MEVVGKMKYQVERNWIYKGKIKKELSKPLYLKEAQNLIKITKPSGLKSWFNLKKVIKLKLRK